MWFRFFFGAYNLSLVDDTQSFYAYRFTNHIAVHVHMMLKHLVVPVKNLRVSPKLICDCSSMPFRDPSCQAVFGCLFEAIESQSAIKHRQVGWYIFNFRGAGTMARSSQYVIYIYVYI